MLLKALKEEKLIFAITAYVSNNLGPKFVESPMATLQLLYVRKSCTGKRKVSTYAFAMLNDSETFLPFFVMSRIQKKRNLTLKFKLKP